MYLKNPTDANRSFPKPKLIFAPGLIIIVVVVVDESLIGPPNSLFAVTCRTKTFFVVVTESETFGSDVFLGVGVPTGTAVAGGATPSSAALDG